MEADQLRRIRGGFSENEKVIAPIECEKTFPVPVPEGGIHQTRSSKRCFQGRGYRVGVTIDARTGMTSVSLIVSENQRSVPYRDYLIPLLDRAGSIVMRLEVWDAIFAHNLSILTR